jgi:hypothetical protein
MQFVLLAPALDVGFSDAESFEEAAHMLKRPLRYLNEKNAEWRFLDVNARALLPAEMAPHLERYDYLSLAGKPG